MNSHSLAEKLTFWQLIEKSKIEIPIIQRDYAQGRKDKSEIRNKFLDALMKAFEDNNSIELDFIYGSQQDSCLQPLDGQQRLTTLFLLHWYIAAKENVLHENRELLKKFTYETRTSSREFCNQLVEYGVDFNKLLFPDIDRAGKSLNNTLSKTIIDGSWFFLSWQKDPTIEAMLTMLDAIHQKYENLENKDNIWERLTIKNSITFLHIPIENFGLSDDLYIKMNARGKALTDFENFKAKFEQFVEEKYGDKKKVFADKMDGDWTDLFWEYKDQESHLFDEQFANFFRVIAVNHYASREQIDENFEANIDLLLNNEEMVSFEKYSELKCFDIDYITFISRVLDKLAQNKRNKKINNFLPGSSYINENLIFENAIANDLGYADLVILYGYSQFLFQEDTINENDTKFILWMRVVRNLVEGSRLTFYNNAKEFVSSIKAINKLILHRDNMLSHLSNLNEDRLTGFLTMQIDEEKLKANLILKNDAWREAIISIENHGYFKGQIGFLLDFSGVSQYFKTNTNVDWTTVENENYFSQFSIYVEKAKAVFDDEGLMPFKDCLFERALLAKGDYLLQKGDNHSFLINNERDISWKRLLRDNTDRRKVLKFLFDSINLSSIQKDLQNIIDEFSDSNDWEYYFIKHAEIIKSCGSSKLIRWINEKNILLLGSSKTSGYHKEYYSYALYLVLKNRVKNISYYDQKSVQDEKIFTIGNDEITISYVNKKYKLLIAANGNVQYFETQEEVIEFLYDNNLLLG